MKTATLDKLIWVLIFGGLLLLALSRFIDPAAAGLVWAVTGLGAGAALVGAALILWRARGSRGTP